MIERKRLSNGLTVLYLHTPNDPISAAHLFLMDGGNSEEDGKIGLTTLLWSLFSKGTKKKSAQLMAEEIEGIGAYIGAGATHDYSEVSCHAVSEYFEQSLELMAEALFEPAFNDSEINKEKIALLAAIRSKKENIFSITIEKFSESIYNGHPYGRPVAGKEATVEKLNRNDLIERHAQIVNPSHAIFSLASDIPYTKISPLLEKLFGETKWPSKTRAPKGKLAPVSVVKEDRVIQNPSHFDQAYLILGFMGTSLGSEDYMPMKILNALLGGGMSARLFQEVREKRGLAYDVGAFYPSRMHESAFVIHTGLQSHNMGEAKKSILEELDKLQKDLVPETELKQTKNHVKGSFILDHQTNSQRAHYVGWWEALGLGASFDNEYIKKVEAVTADQIRAMAKKYFGQPYVSVETHPVKK